MAQIMKHHSWGSEYIECSYCGDNFITIRNFAIFRKHRVKREAQELIQKLQKEIDKLKKTIDELDKRTDLQVSPENLTSFGL